MKKIRNGLLALASLAISLIIVEIALTLFIFNPNYYYPFKPYTQWAFNLSKSVSPSANGPTVFSTNRYGIRGDEPDSEHDIRLLVLGGSTAENLYIDDKDAWPQVLQSLLRSHFNYDGIWVGNAGKSGIRAHENVLYLKHFVPQIDDIRYLLVLLGSNDLGIAFGMANLDDWNPHQRLRHAFQFLPNDNGKYFPYNTAVFGVIDEVIAKYSQWQSGVVQDRSGEWILTARQRRKNSRPYLDKMPDLQSNVNLYHERLNQFVDLARASNIEPIFITQPLLHNANITPEEDASIGVFAGKGSFHDLMYGPDPIFYSPGIVGEAIEFFHDATMDVCHVRKMNCVELAAKLPKQLDYFYDGVHYTVRGNHKIAEIIFSEITTQLDFYTNKEIYDKVP